MSVEENRALMQRLVAAMDKGDWAALDGCLAPEFTYHNPALPTVRTREDFRQLLIAMRTAFPPGHWTEDEAFTSGEMAAGIATFHGVHRAPYRGVAPTGKDVEIQTVNIHRIAGGKIVEVRGLSDTLGLLVSIGAIPAPAQPTQQVPRQAAA